METFLLQHGLSPALATNGAREARDFHHLGTDCLWITFARDHLWWTFVETDVVWLMNDFVLTGERVRKSIGGWRRTNIAGAYLTIDRMGPELLHALSNEGEVSAGALRDLLCLINGTRPISRSVPMHLHTVAEVTETPSKAPNESGLYAWWFDQLPGVPLEGSLRQGNFKLAYVGIASHRPGSRRTLSQRLRNHCKGPSASSTLRRSLIAILSKQLNRNPYLGPDKKLKLPQDEEVLLSDWLSSHGRMAWICDPEPWVRERRLLDQGPPLALNILGNDHEFTAKLRSLRRELIRRSAGEPAAN